MNNLRILLQQQRIRLFLELESVGLLFQEVEFLHHQRLLPVVVGVGEERLLVLDVERRELVGGEVGLGLLGN